MSLRVSSKMTEAIYSRRECTADFTLPFVPSRLGRGLSSPFEGGGKGGGVIMKVRSTHGDLMAGFYNT